MRQFKDIKTNFKEGFERKLEKVLEHKSGKRAMITGAVSVVLLSSTIGAGIYQDSITAYQVKVEDEVLVTINRESALEEAIEAIETEKAQKYDSEVEVVDEFEVEPVEADGTELQSVEKLQEELKDEVEVLISGYSIVVEGEEIAYFNTKEEAEDVLQEIKNKALENYDSESVSSSEFDREIKIEEKKISSDKIMGVEEAVNHIEAGGEEVIDHEMKSGENFWTISQQYEVPVEEIEAANPDIDPTSVRDGEIVNINTVEPYFNVAVELEIERTEAVTFETKTQEDASMYNDQQKVAVEGQDGKVLRRVRLVEVDGEKIEEEILEENIVEEPVDKVIVKGTKERPKGIGTGDFRTPANGRFTSGFGPRWGRMHKGIDIAAPIGTPIVASDNGKVVEVSYNAGGYGKKLVVDHGNGYKTLYAHANRIHVSVGQVVSSGDIIAEVGNTGRSTGPHLHFEVIKNGTPVNPSNYI